MTLTRTLELWPRRSCRLLVPAAASARSPWTTHAGAGSQGENALLRDPDLLLSDTSEWPRRGRQGLRGPVQRLARSRTAKGHSPGPLPGESMLLLLSDH